MNRKNGAADLVVVGGGVVGLSAAWEVSRRGHRVIVLERAEVGAESSWAAAGMLSPLAEASSGGPTLRFGLASRTMYPTWVRQIEDRSGTSVEYRVTGKLQVAMDASEVGPLHSLVRLGRAADVPCSWLDANELRRLEPSLSGDALGALYMEEDGRVDPRRLAVALASGCRLEGAEIREGTAVTSLEHAGGRVRGVTLENGTHIAAHALLVAAGAWSAALGGLPRPLPVVPVRGQMLSLRPASIPSPRLIGRGHIYVVPRDDGRVLVGATMEEAGFAKAVTPDGIAELRSGAAELIPSLASAPTGERWSGLRPGTRDGLPIIGTDPEVEGLHYATGHFRNGILLAPITGRVVADLVETGRARALPTDFGPGRFMGAPSLTPATAPD